MIRLALPVCCAALLFSFAACGRMPAEETTDAARASGTPDANTQDAPTMQDDPMTQDAPPTYDDAHWRKTLTAEEYRVLRQKGTERAFTGKYWDTKTDGVYHCRGCGEALFVSDAKFDSGCGWPSFFQPLDGARLTETRDTSHGMVRTEITCTKCGGHLGHVFNDGPAPTGLRYCINSVSIDLKAKGDKQDGE